MEYDFTATHIKGKDNEICDSLSRLPVPPKGATIVSSPQQKPTVTSEELASTMSVKFASVQCDYDIDIMESVQCLAKLPIHNESPIDNVSISKVIGSTTEHLWNKFPLTARDVATATREDKVLGKLATAIRTGSINVKDQDLKPFNSVFQDLYLENEVIFHGQRIVIPERQRVRLMDELYTSHIGVFAP